MVFPLTAFVTALGVSRYLVDAVRRNPLGAWVGNGLRARGRDRIWGSGVLRLCGSLGWPAGFGVDHSMVWLTGGLGVGVVGHWVALEVLSVKPNSLRMLWHAAMNAHSASAAALPRKRRRLPPWHVSI